MASLPNGHRSDADNSAERWPTTSYGDAEELGGGEERGYPEEAQAHARRVGGRGGEGEAGTSGNGAQQVAAGGGEERMVTAITGSPARFLWRGGRRRCHEARGVLRFALGGFTRWRRAQWPWLGFGRVGEQRERERSELMEGRERGRGIGGPLVHQGTVRRRPSGFDGDASVRQRRAGSVATGEEEGRLFCRKPPACILIFITF